MADELTFAIFIFDDVEVLDACGPFEVFSTAARLADDTMSTPKVVTVAQGPGPVNARGGLRLMPDHQISDDLDVDVLVVPGGVTEQAERQPDVIDWIKRTSGEAQLTAGVCTGAFLLAEAGLLDGRPATTHWADEAELAERWPAVRVETTPRWVDDGDLVTSAGISAGIDMSLHLVRRLYGLDLARATARLMEYHWQEEPAASMPAADAADALLTS